MKHRVIFEPRDFYGCGQIIVRESFPRDCTDYSQAITLAYKIGFMSDEEKNSRIVMISLADGLVLKCGSVEQLCERLNNDSEGYRPMSDVEISGMMLSIGNRFSL